MRKIDDYIIRKNFSEIGGKILLGIDGFTDDIWEIVSIRNDTDDYKIFEKMQDFSKSFASCPAGGYANEIVRKRRSHGGFTAHTGRTVIHLGGDLTMLGRFGREKFDPVFDDFAKRSNLLSVGDPGICEIFEFTDGKLMFVYIQEVVGFNWHDLTGVIPENQLKDLFTETDVIGIGYWSLMPAFDDIISRICGLLKNNGKKQRMFFDPADIRKRSKEDLVSTLDVLAGLNGQIPMTLSLNEHEAAIMFSYYDEVFSEDAAASVAQTERVRNIIGLDELVVHTPYFAVAASEEEGACAVIQNYCESPVKTTGAGDNFNGGYITALQKQLPIAERLAVGNATTYLYVSRGDSPTREELFEELKDNEIMKVLE